MKRMVFQGVRRRAAAAGVGAILAIVALGTALVATTASAAVTFPISAGAQSGDGTVQIYDFIPKPVAINVGDTVTWTVPSLEFHTVTFFSGAPNEGFVVMGPRGPMINPVAAFPTGGPNYDGTGVVSSGLLEKDQTFSLTFTKAGTYDYVCMVHPKMVAQVIVREAGEAADTPESVQAQVAPHVANDLATRTLNVLLSNLKDEMADGAVSTVIAGAGDGHVAVYAFLPGRAAAGVGDVVTWINKDTDTPHTVTFLAGNDAPEVVMPQPQPAGPPLLLLNSAVVLPSGLSEADAYDGSVFLNSGFIGPESPTGSTAFSVRFTRPGTYSYVCLLHPIMKGTVTVLE